MKYLLSIITTVLLLSASWAQESDDKGELTFSGYVDAYYSYNLNRPGDNFNDARVFDYRHNSITAGMVQAQATYRKGDLELVGDITFGPNANVANYGNPGTTNIIKQAYIKYYFNDRFTLTVGQYGTHMGFEPVEATKNFNYSLSYQFSTGPIYHTGIKLDYVLNENWTAMIGVVNGWDELIDANDKKSITAQVATTAINNMELALSWIGGDEFGSPANFGNYEGSYTSFFDFVGKYQISEKFLIGVNSGYGTFKTAAQFQTGDPHSNDGSWWAAALYLQYYPMEHLGLGFRGERLDDPDNLRTGFGSLNGLTFTVDYHMSENFIIKPEIRIDQSEQSVFDSSDGQDTTQPTLGIAFIGKIN